MLPMPSLRLIFSQDRQFQQTSSSMKRSNQKLSPKSFYTHERQCLKNWMNSLQSIGQQCTITHRFVQYTPRKVFNSFVQSVVDAKRTGEENPISGLVAETMKLLENSSYGYQLMDRSKHTMKKYLGDKKTIQLSKTNFFRRLNIVAKDLYQELYEVLNLL